MNFKFRSSPFSFKGEGESGKTGGLSKRREQVRNAQRTYRERKEAYVRALETEILQLRSREAAIMQETQEIYAEINDLRRTLVAHGIDPPAPIIRTNPKQSFKLTIEDYHGGRKICTQPEKDPLARKHEKQPSFETAIPSAPPDHEIKLSDPERRQDPVCPTGKQLPPLPEQRTPRTQQAVANPSSQSSALASELDRTSAGIDFVLSLESPCLEHVENGLLDTAASHGHALTASATLLFNANQRSSPQNEPFRSWEASSVSLERLLSLSSGLPLDGCVTPVQAWDCIRHHPAFGALGRSQLKHLANSLLAQVECHGFGAVIDNETFGNLVQRMFLAVGPA